MDSKSRIPHFEKILIGPLMVLGEMITGGHYNESLKILKQATNKSYPNLMRGLWREHKFRGFYLGFYPWGLSQIVKGLPVLFVQAETHNFLTKNTNITKDNAMILSGMCGGMSQGVFVTPTQRLKTIVMTYPQSDGRNLNSLEIIKETYRRGGFKTFYSGLLPMVIRRGFDWALRFQGYHWMENRIKKYKKIDKITLTDKINCGIFGGMLATITTPLDVCVAESQKYSNKEKSLYNVVNEVYNNYGWRGFVRGWGIRVIHSCYHTVWVCGVGSFVFNYIREL